MLLPYFFPSYVYIKLHLGAGSIFSQLIIQFIKTYHSGFGGMEVI